MHFVIYLPAGYYAAIAAATVEVLQAVNTVSAATVFTYEFVSGNTQPVSRSGAYFPAKRRPSRKADVLVLLAGAGTDTTPDFRLLDNDARAATPLIKDALKREAVIAATCGAAYLLAASHTLDGRRATISWWMQKEVKALFPQVLWEPSRLLVRDGRLYTSGGGFSGLELITTLVNDLGYKKEMNKVRKLMVLPPSRELQSPYEMPQEELPCPFEKKLLKLSRNHLEELSLPFLAKQFDMSTRTLSRRFFDELAMSPGKWIQQKRMEIAKTLLIETALNISEICYRIGYEDIPSFTRLFSRTTGMTPTEYRRQIRQ
ncbi:MAG TPA: helix-turn-helix domain-containing protein [Chitinophaga sp.]|uniref:GlxA family transcriptional regulator n=1 Tax=Chitinophaga sp. TaxID=1869181 RepID=UPI002B9FE93A|nr:helix-turn-helix domain-containing protein [Chitinophaga sp.]HVI43922.1 helix-turn-helix domain-containing protein [Chitinophaga sp.]